MNLLGLIDTIAESSAACESRVVDALDDLGYLVFHHKGEFVFGVPFETRISPVLLMAHLDTRRVNDDVIPLRNGDVIYNANKAAACLGADDRAGVYIVLEMIKTMPLKPYVLFTQGEETGYTGASTFIQADHPETPDLPLAFTRGKKIWEPYKDDIYAILQYDFPGFNHFTAYGNGDLAFELMEIPKKFGYTFEPGLSSDSIVLSKVLDTAHVNMSCGYINPHRTSEMLLIPTIPFAVANGPRIISQITKHHPMPYRLPEVNRPRFQFTHTPSTFVASDPACDICGRARKVTFVASAMAFVCEKCVNRAGGISKITLESVEQLANELELERIKSKTNNLPFTPSCPLDRTHKEVYLLGNDVCYCTDCKTYFCGTELGKTFFWSDAEKGVTNYQINCKPADKYKVPLTSAASFVGECSICGDVMPKKYLKMEWSRDDDALLCATCPACMKALTQE